MITISRTFPIQAAHRLPNTPPDHKCHRLHGHTWHVRLEVLGPLHPTLGWIVDYGDLDAAWQEHVHRVLDHGCMNDTLPNPTTELLAMWIWIVMYPPVRALGASLVRVEIDEGDRNRCVFLAAPAWDAAAEERARAQVFREPSA